MVHIVAGNQWRRMFFIWSAIISRYLDHNHKFISHLGPVHYSLHTAPTSNVNKYVAILNTYWSIHFKIL